MRPPYRPVRRRLSPRPLTAERATPTFREVHQFLQTAPVREVVDAYASGANPPQSEPPSRTASEERATYSDLRPDNRSPAEVLTWARFNGLPNVERDDRRRRVEGSAPIVLEDIRERQATGQVADPTADYHGEIAASLRNGAWWRAGVSVVPRQSWSGRVTQVRGDTFIARLFDPADPHNEKQAELLIDSLSNADRRRVRPGARFTWVIGYRDEGSTRTGVSMIRFKRGRRTWSDHEWEQALADARARGERLDRATQAAKASDAAYRSRVEHG